MTKLRFRVDEADALDAKAWADRLGLRRSDLLREALQQHLHRLTSEDDTEPTPPEGTGWGPAEDWSDWSDTAG
jgi:hypothetical protein